MPELTSEGQPPENPANANREPVRRRPPTMVWVACGLLVFFALLSVGIALALSAMGTERFGGFWVLITPVSLAVIYVVVAVAVFRGMAWARWTGIAIGVVSVALSVVTAITSGQFPNCLGLILQIGVVVLLLRKDVAEWCRPR